MLGKTGTLAIMVSLCMAQTPPAWATPESQESTMVVTATRTERLQNEVPVTVSVIGSKELSRSTDTTLGELIRDIPGVELVDDSMAGMQRIVIRGESSHRTLTLIDGQKISDQKSMSGAPMLVDVNNIERIEVIKGPGSVLYGSEAIGGVINIITKKGGDKPLSVTLSSAYTSATEGWNNHLALFGSSKGFDYRLSGTLADHGDRKTPDETLDNSSYEIQSGNAYMGWSGENLAMGLTLESYDADLESHTAAELITETRPHFQLDLPEWRREKAGLFVESRNLTGIIKKVRADIFTQKSTKEFHNDISVHTAMGPTMSMDIDNKIRTDNDQTTRGGLLQVDLAPAKNHLLIAGVDASRDDLESDDTAHTTLTKTGMGPMPIVTHLSSAVHNEASMENLAIFAQDEWTLGNLILTGGLRHAWTDATLDEGPATAADTSSDTSKTVGSLGMSWRAADPLTFRVNLAQGYRVPTLQQLFMGTSHGDDGKAVLPNGDLNPETSNNAEVGVHYQTPAIVADLALFASSAEDYITTTEVNATTRTFSNMDEAETYGAELSLQANLGETGISPYLSGTFLRRTYETETYKTHDTGSPALSGRGGVRYEGDLFSKAKCWTDLYMRAATESQEYDDTKKITKTNAGWGTLNLATGLHFGKEHVCTTTLEFTNILDKAYVPSHQTLLASGRAVAVKLSATF